MKVVAVTCHVLLDPGYDAEATSSNQDTIVVELDDRRGPRRDRRDRPQRVDRARLHRGARHPHDGSRPRPSSSSAWIRPIRSVLGRALRRHRHDRPARRARARARRDRHGALGPRGQGGGRARPGSCSARRVPRASSCPTPRCCPRADAGWEGFAETLAGQAIDASRRGFRAAKLELLTRGPYRHSGLSIPDERLVEVIAAVREATGPGFAIMVDVGYGWERLARGAGRDRDLGRARRVLRRDAALERRHRRLRRARPPLADPDRRRRVARDAPRVRGVHGAQRAGRAAARRRTRRRPDRGAPGHAARGRARADASCRTAGRPGSPSPPPRTSRRSRRTCRSSSSCPPSMAESRLRRELVRDELVLREDGTLALPEPSRPRHRARPRALAEFSRGCGAALGVATPARVHASRELRERRPGQRHAQLAIPPGRSRTELARQRDRRGARARAAPSARTPPPRRPRRSSSSERRGSARSRSRSASCPARRRLPAPQPARSTCPACVRTPARISTASARPKPL